MAQNLPKTAKPVDKKRVISLVGGLTALAIACLGEYLMRIGKPTAPNLQPQPNAAVGMALYAIAIIIFAVTALWPHDSLLSDAQNSLEFKNSAKTRKSAVIIFIGVAISFAFGFLSFSALNKNIKSLDGALFWCTSMIALLTFSALGTSGFTHLPFWSTQSKPESSRTRTFFIGALVLLLIVLATTRLLGVDAIPIGINPDEGDRGSNAVAVLRNTTPQGFFQSGWYRISMVYFSILGAFLRITGPGYMEARWFHGVCSIATALFITFIGVRNFNWRTGLIAGFITSSLGIAIQFGRVTTEATPTALLWTASAFFFLEAFRRGSMWGWVAAGLCGGFSIYFYPQGRLWAVLAALWCVYLFVTQPGRKRILVIFGAFLAAFSALIVAMPFFVNIKDNFWEFSRRFEETSAFVGGNAQRLPYYNPDWSEFQFIGEQLRRSLFVFNQFADGGGLWPHGQPILQPITSVLTLVGLGWALLKWRTPRFVLLSLWFWVGISGMVITVETPNVQRMATSIPLIGLFAAITLDEIVRRFKLAYAHISPNRNLISLIVTIFCSLIILGIASTELKFYFVDYAKMDLWRPWNAEADAVHDQGTDTRVITLERSWFMIKSGWTNLKALDVPRFGMKSPGSMLPLGLADKNLSFLIYPHQSHYLPYLQTLYPSAIITPVYNTPPATNHLLFWMMRIEQKNLALSQGSTAQADGDSPHHVSTIGEVPQIYTPENSASRMTWKSGLRITRSWNYAFRSSDSNSSLTIDGIKIQLNPPKPIFLPLGDHYVVFESGTKSAGKSLLEWSQTSNQSVAENSAWQSIPTELLLADQTAPRGLVGEVAIENKPHLFRMDNALANCCVSEGFTNNGRLISITWEGNLEISQAGLYEFWLATEGSGKFEIDNSQVIFAGNKEETNKIQLAQGSHAIKIIFDPKGVNGRIEWSWKPPSGPRSIVPPSVLSPLAGSSIKPALTSEELIPYSSLPSYRPLE